MEIKKEITDSEVKRTELVLNRYLKKYSWFKKIKLNSIGYTLAAGGQFSLDGWIFVDENWLGNQWGEFHHSMPFPDLEDEDYSLSFGDFIGGELAEKLRDEVIMIFTGTANVPRPKYMSWSWLEVKPVSEEDDILRESIKKVLKEHNMKNQLQKLVDKIGFTQACKAVGGIHNISKIFNLTPIELLNKYFIGNKLSTDDIKDMRLSVGGYDFKFIPTSIYQENGVFRVVYKLTEGTIQFIMGNNQIFDLFDDELREKDYSWEIDYEIHDLLWSYTIQLFTVLFNRDFGEASGLIIADFYYAKKNEN